MKNDHLKNNIIHFFTNILLRKHITLYVIIGQNTNFANVDDLTFFFFFFAGKCVMHVPRPGERTEGSVGLLPTKNLRCPSKHLRRGHGDNVLSYFRRPRPCWSATVADVADPSRLGGGYRPPPRHILSEGRA